MHDDKAARLRDLLIKWAFLDSATIELLRRAGQVFDDTYYLAVNKDVAPAGMDPLRHFLLYGLMEGRAPSAGWSNTRCREAFGEILGSDRKLRFRLRQLRHIHVVSRGTVERLAGRTPGHPLPFWAQPGFATREIDLCYIRNSDDWQAGNATISSAIRQFKTEFVTGIRPFSQTLAPDADFYAALNGRGLTAL